jgi:hypothetical protein
MGAEAGVGEKAKKRAKPIDAVHAFSRIRKKPSSSFGAAK